MKNILFTCVFLCLLSHSVKAQGDNSLQSICHQLDSGKPRIYLEFEKVERSVSGSKTSSENIVLRLSNNSACDLIFLANTPMTIRVVRAPNVEPRVEKTNLLLPNVLADLHLRLIDWRTKKHLSLISSNHLVYDRVLTSGQSTIFAVPAWWFKKYSEIGVSIEYRRAKAFEGADNKYELFTQKVEAPKSGK
jgi:hypothetical protein